MASTRASRKPGPGRPPTGRAQTPAERMRRLRARRKAAGLRPVVEWAPANEARPPYSSHRLLEARSLAMHALIAAKISRDRALLAIARANLDRWGAKWGSRQPRWVAEWRRLLERPWPEVLAVMTEPSEMGARLRQSSPFAGVLSVAERRRIYDAFRA